MIKGTENITKDLLMFFRSESAKNLLSPIGFIYNFEDVYISTNDGNKTGKCGLCNNILWQV